MKRILFLLAFIQCVAVAQPPVWLGLGSKIDSVDMRVNLTHSGNFNAVSTFYSAIEGSLTGNATEAAMPNSLFGMGGRVVGIYFQSRTNTLSQTATITLQYADSSTAALSATPFVMTIPLGAKAVAVTNKTHTITPWQMLGYKYVSAGGTGAITLFSITLIVRVPKI